MAAATQVPSFPTQAKPPPAFTGVSLIRGSGTLSGPILEVQPYKVTAETCYANDCALTVSPPIASSEAAGTEVSNAGTCQLYATSAALPSGPLAPDGVSYWDGCQWEARDVSVTGNNFVFQPSLIAASAPPQGTATSTVCTASHTDSCGTNFMAYQASGEAPFGNQTGANALMSSSSFTGCPSWDTGCATNPLANINALSNPPGATAKNGERPGNNVWSNNTYIGPWGWNAYLFGACWPLPTDPTTGRSMPSSACGLTDFSHWHSDWQQDASSTYRPQWPGSSSSLAISVRRARASRRRRRPSAERCYGQVLAASIRLAMLTTGPPYPLAASRGPLAPPSRDTRASRADRAYRTIALPSWQLSLPARGQDALVVGTTPQERTRAASLILIHVGLPAVPALVLPFGRAWRCAAACIKLSVAADLLIVGSTWQRAAESLAEGR